MLSLATIGSTIANSRPAQYALGGALAVAAFLIWLARHDAGIRRSEEIRAERKARKTQSKLQDKSNEKSTQVAAARQSIPDVSHSDQLSGDTRSQLFGDRGSRG